MKKWLGTGERWGLSVRTLRLSAVLLLSLTCVLAYAQQPAVNHRGFYYSALPHGTQPDFIFQTQTTTAGHKVLSLRDAGASEVFAVDKGGNVTFAGTATMVGTTTSLAFTGSVSGTITMAPQAAAGTYNFNLPTSAGTSGQPLLSGGGGAGAMTFGTLGVAGGGTGLATLTAHAVYVGNAASAPTALSVGATNSVLQGSTGADPAFTTTPTVTSIGAQVVHHYGGSVQTVPDGTTTLAVAAGVGTLLVKGTGGATTLGGTPIITAGTTVGQRLIIIGTDDTNTVIVPDSGNCALGGARTLGNTDTLGLVWNGTAWCETSFVNN